MSDPVLRARGLCKTFREGSLVTAVLEHIDLDIRAGERVAIVGSSGAGKSTLMHLLGGLDLPSSGQVEVMGQAMSSLGEAARGRLRNRALGFIYQFHHLLPEFTAVENVAMPLLVGGVAPAAARTRAMALLERVGLGHRLRHKPGEMSGGERQRAAVARALVNRPRCLLADEPTGNLDRANAAQVLELMLELNRESGVTLVVVTHDMAIAGRMSRTLRMEDGRLQH